MSTATAEQPQTKRRKHQDVHSNVLKTAMKHTKAILATAPLDEPTAKVYADCWEEWADELRQRGEPLDDDN